MEKKEQEMVSVKVDGVEQIRKIDYSVRRSKKEVVHYPVLKKYEHIYENDNEVIVFTSLVV